MRRDFRALFSIGGSRPVKRWIIGNDPLVIAIGTDKMPLEPGVQTDVATAQGGSQ